MAFSASLYMNIIFYIDVLIDGPYVLDNEIKDRTNDMNRTEITNANGIKFYIEQSADFDVAGLMVAGRGWYAGLVKGDDDMSGVFFETRDQATDAIADFAVAA